MARPTLRPSWAREHAANDDFTLPRPAPANAATRGSPDTARLASAVLISLMLHVGLAVLVSSTLTYTAVIDSAGPPLTVTLARPRAPAIELADARPFATTSDATRDPRIGRETLEPPQTPARFLTDPDLSVLEEIPTTIPGIVTLRLKVTSQGNVEGVSVIRADPVPRELLDGLIERFGKAKLAPATVGSQPTASTIEVTIRVDPPAQFFEPGR